MEDNIFDFSKFKRDKESRELKPAEKTVEERGLSDLQSLMMSMVQKVKESGATDDSLTDTLASLTELGFLPNAETINSVRASVNTSSTAYKEAYNRAEKLSAEEVRGQIENANDNLINSHPTWYVSLLDVFINRSKIR